MRFVLSFIVSSLIASSALAFELELPIDCQYGETCFVQNYVDTDPSPEWKDFACGKLSYNGHDGTDIRLKTFVEMERGVAVLAAADGVVKGLRDEIPDTGIENPEVFKNKECGNGVVIEHAEGWRTQYCHMKRGSIRVRKGQQVKAGDILGQVGYSGQTAFPHVHLTVFHNGKIVDPFTNQPTGSNTACNAHQEGGLWDKRAGIRYIPTALLASGFTTQAPDQDGVLHGKFNEQYMAKDAPFLIAWVSMMGIQAGDILQIRITAPDGTVFFTKDEAFANPKATQFNYAGRKRIGANWLPGTYTGSITLVRGNSEVFRQNLAINVKN